MKIPYTFPKDNPLFRFYNESGISWVEIAKVTGLTVVTLIRLATKKPKDLLKISLGTYIVLKEKYDIDLAETINYKEK